jgi:molecular chaperone GrpE
MTDKPVSEPVDVPPDASDPLDGAAVSAEAPAEPDPVAELKRERDEFQDRWLRKTAEFDNYRKRIERERREQSDQALVGLLLDLLAVVDDFDLALTVEAGPEAEGYRRGVELIHAKLHDFLKRRGVTPIDAVGADFDPNVHQAVMHEVSPEHREGEVIGELRKGYMLGDRLLRPAMVRVAKA